MSKENYGLMLAEMDRIDLDSLATGQIPVEFKDLNVIDLASFGLEDDFELPGEHKRIRAGVGAVATRAGHAVKFETATGKVYPSDSTYQDYDRTFDIQADTSGSEWGSERGAYVRMIRADHISNSGAIYEYEPDYADQYFTGVFTDQNGLATTLGVLKIEKIYDLHPEVARMVKNIGNKAVRLFTEACMSDIEKIGFERLCGAYAEKSHICAPDCNHWFDVVDHYDAKYYEDAWGDQDVDEFVLLKPKRLSQFPQVSRKIEKIHGEEGITKLVRSPFVRDEKI